MKSNESNVTRRWFINRLGVGAGAIALGSLWTPGVFAEELMRTPAQTEGPFYPDHLPLDTDNDLLIVNNQITPAVGEVTHLSGRILDTSGEPVRNVLVEIWQVDANAAYIHSKDRNRAKHDTNFQGFGRFLTGSSGEYYFRTIKPVPYPGRTPHIHLAIHRKGAEKFTTQCYIKGHPGNERDGIFRQVATTPALHDLIAIDFAPIPNSTIGELAAKFDVVLGQTPVV